MKPIEYINHLRMDQENYEFNRQDFINMLKKDLLDSIQNHPLYNPKKKSIPYQEFRALVKTFQDKFEEISRLKQGKALSQGLWNAFYSIVVVNYRNKYYPHIQAYIKSQRDNKS